MPENSCTLPHSHESYTEKPVRFHTIFFPKLCRSTCTLSQTLVLGKNSPQTIVLRANNTKLSFFKPSMPGSNSMNQSHVITLTLNLCYDRESFNSVPVMPG